METENPQLYGRLTSDLTAENVKAIQEIFKLGEQRNEARRSKKIEEAGGKNNVLSFYGFKNILDRPNNFGRVPIVLDGSNLFWSGQNHFGQVQIIKVSTEKSNFNLTKMI